MKDIKRNILEIETTISILKGMVNDPLPKFVPKDKQVLVRRTSLKMIADQLNEDVSELLNNLSK